MTATRRTLVGCERNWTSVSAGRTANTSDDAMAGGEGEPTAETLELVALMSTGATDRVIARELGVSERTVHRRIARLQVLLGVQSRFQFGLHVAANNWLL